MSLLLWVIFKKGCALLYSNHHPGSSSQMAIAPCSPHLSCVSFYIILDSNTRIILDLNKEPRIILEWISSRVTYYLTCTRIVCISTTIWSAKILRLKRRVARKCNITSELILMCVLHMYICITLCGQVKGNHRDTSVMYLWKRDTNKMYPLKSYALNWYTTFFMFP